MHVVIETDSFTAQQHSERKCTVPNLNIVANLYIVAIAGTIGHNILHCVLAVMTVVTTVL